FLWGVPPDGLAQTLSQHFARVFVVLDVGCFSQSQRLEQMRRELLKPCPTNEALLEFISAAKQFSNLELEVSGIAGLPFATEATLHEERALIEHLLGLGCTIGYQRLQVQPGALVTEHPERFGMTAEAGTFAALMRYFEALAPSVDEFPLVRYRDPAFE